MLPVSFCSLPISSIHFSYMGSMLLLYMDSSHLMAISFSQAMRSSL